MFERYSESARRVLFFSRNEAGMLGSPAIEVEHLLLGLLREGKSIPVRIFEGYSISVTDLQRQLEAAVARSGPGDVKTDVPFSADAKRALLLAAEEADGLNHPTVGPEHLLLAVLRMEKSFAAGLLEKLGVYLNRVRFDIVQLRS